MDEINYLTGTLRVRNKILHKEDGYSLAFHQRQQHVTYVSLGHTFTPRWYTLETKPHPEEVSLVLDHTVDQVEATKTQQNTFHAFTHIYSLYCPQKLFTYVIPDVKLQDGNNYKHNLLILKKM